MRLGDLLVESKIITEAQLVQALEIQKNSGGQKLGEILVDIGVITEEEMLGVLQKKLQVPFVKAAELANGEALMASFPEETAREKLVFPYKLQGNTLYVATSDPLDYYTLNRIGVATGKNIETVIATRNDLFNTINKFYNKHNMESVTNVLNDASDTPVRDLSQIDLEDVESRVGSVPVVKFISNLIIQAHQKRASDIHIEVTEDNVRVRFRVDGELIEIAKLNKSVHASIVTRIKIMADMDIAEKRIPLDGRFDLDIEGSILSVRAASMPTVYGEKIVLRLMADNKSGILPLEALGINEENSAAIRKAITLPNGLILVTGPTGSGKSTTVYSLLNELSTSNTNILTVEDPVEKIVPGVNQTQINPKAGLTFATGLRAILRQDPDKIMIGEIRDTETADIAARAAITGHLVLASMHTNNAASAYMRLVDMGIEPYVVASSVICIIAQRLVRLICPHCKVIYEPTQADLNYFQRTGTESIPTLYIGKGCDKCDYTGYYGRTSIHEVIVTDQTIRTMIMEKAKTSDIVNYLTTTKKQRYIIDDAYRLILEGKIFFRELLNFIDTME